MQTTDIIQATATPEEMLHPGSRALFRYWETIRGEMSAPPRDRVDLKKISSLIPFLFMIERKPGTDYVWRLAGTRVCELWGMKLTDKPVLTHGERSECETVARLFDGVIDVHQPFVVRFRLKCASGTSTAAEFVGMPLRSRNGQTTYVLGVITAFRSVTRPRHDHVTGLELSAARTIWTEPVPGAANRPAVKAAWAKFITGFPDH